MHGGGGISGNGIYNNLKRDCTCMRSNGPLPQVELFAELNLVQTSDPFCDPKDPLQPQAENICFENDLDTSQFNRGQLCSYAAAHVGSQFCVHTITLSICGQSARFIVGLRRRNCYPELRLHRRTAYPCLLFLVIHILLIASADTTLLSH